LIRQPSIAGRIAFMQVTDSNVTTVASIVLTNRAGAVMATRF
jgi:hypothetical protein